MTLNEAAWLLADEMEASAAALRLAVDEVAGARVLDCGVKAAGGLRAGLALARVCLAGRGDVGLHPAGLGDLPCPLVQVTSDEPVTACLASQYAGWQVAAGKFFAMGSGPMRAAYGKEALFDRLPGRETAARAVGCLETRKPPTPEAVDFLCGKLGLPPAGLTLLTAPAASLAGTLQVVARSLETALHKLDELGFDVTQVASGHGTAPLPPVGRDELQAVGWTNDAILYGGRVTLWVRADDAVLAEVGPRVPSSASAMYGEPFAKVFEAAGRDFYKIDKALFSPAAVVFHNLATGRSHAFGAVAPDVLRRSFAG
jgi:methenyltetrahydromethanopterin cyclohydrolase